MRLPNVRRPFVERSVPRHGAVMQTDCPGILSAARPLWVAADRAGSATAAAGAASEADVSAGCPFSGRRSAYRPVRRRNRPAGGTWLADLPGTRPLDRRDGFRLVANRRRVRRAGGTPRRAVPAYARAAQRRRGDSMFARGDKTAIELFLAGIRGWETRLLMQISGKK